MKILVVSNMYPDKKNVGTGTFVKNFCNQLEFIGMDYSICVMKKRINKAAKLLEYIFFYFKTFFLCVFIDYSLVYIHYPSFSSAPVMLAKKIRKFDMYVNVHGSDVIPVKKSQKKMHRFTKKAIENADKIIVPSNYFMKVVIKKYKINKDNVFVYPSGGVDLNIFRCYEDKKIDSLKNTYNVPINVPVIGFVGRITLAKGWDVFISAASKLIQDGYECVFLMVGSGEDDHRVLDEIKKYNLSRYIIRYPLLSQEKLVDVYNICDLFVFPTISSSESLGLVAIEAMACGCPVIASDFAAPSGYIIDAYNGYKFPKGDSSALARKIKNYLNSNHDIRKSLTVGALETSKEYSKEASIDLLKKIL